MSVNWNEQPISRIKVVRSEDVPDVLNIDSITTLELLKEYILQMKHPLSVNKTMVFEDGRGPYLIIGEAPGAEENKQGIPFVGKSGQLLRKVLYATLQKHAIEQKMISIINIVPWQPEGNRTPTWKEITDFTYVLQKQIELRMPKAILCLGSVATRGLFLNDKLKITELRGVPQLYRNIPTICTIHPSLVLRDASYLKFFAEDIELFVTTINNGIIQR